VIIGNCVKYFWLWIHPGTIRAKSLFGARSFSSVKTPTVKSRFKIIHLFPVKPAPVKDLEDLYFFENPGKIDRSNDTIYFLTFFGNTGKIGLLKRYRLFK
jgi:hypothetical protein